MAGYWFGSTLIPPLLRVENDKRDGEVPGVETVANEFEPFILFVFSPPIRVSCKATNWDSTELTDFLYGDGPGRFLLVPVTVFYYCSVVDYYGAGIVREQESECYSVVL